MQQQNHLIIYGGSFDPLHNGHIQLAREASRLTSAKIIFIPCKQSLLKAKNTANSQQRLRMLELGLEAHPDFSIDTRELTRKSPSYMVETLESIRQEHLHSKISLLLGMDSFNSLSDWYQWQNLLSLANIIVIDRALVNKNMDLMQQLQKNTVSEIDALSQSGKLYFHQAAIANISSTQIRALLKDGQEVRGLLPEKVLAYIKENKLYCTI